MKLQEKYKRDSFIEFLNSFLPQYTNDIRVVDANGLKVVQEAYYLGECAELDLSIFELTHISTKDARVTLANDGFKIMKNSAVYQALVVYQADKGDDWRLSLMTTTFDINQKGRAVQEFSNPRRFSFFLGPNAKIHTPAKYLIELGRVKDFDDLKTRFSLEVVNKDFYNSISVLFTKLVGGQRAIGKDKFEGEGSLQLPSTSDHRKKQEFTTRLLGRIIFCWFLKKKKSSQGKPLISDNLLSSESLANVSNYYHDILEPLFFQQLNTPQEQRRDGHQDLSIPFLNGGLFQDHNDDFYDIDDFHGFSKYYNTLSIPNEWFKELFEVLETYNFTIDESTSVDIDLSVDPEMLGRIFENLLAEVNPETGETARKATGSYYTPRPIVEYMVDESLKHYLTSKTGVDLDRLAQILSYSEDLPKLTQRESNLLIEFLYDLKIIDPACGSGAFPMGILQKAVLILQKIDPDCKQWLDKQISDVPDTYLHNILEEKLKNENLNYIRKLGIVQNTVYGVDIQPIAVEIARLRFFLSLIVDEDVDDGKKNRGLQSLPNLEFKFVCANSLVELDDPFQAGFLKDKFFNSFELLSKNYFAVSDPKKKQDLRKGIEILIRKKLDDNFSKVINITKTSITDARFNEQLKQKHTKTISKLSYEAELWESYLNIFKDEPVGFFNPRYFFPEVKHGFDIVLANPPYIGERGHKELFRDLRRNGWACVYYQRKMDLFYFFFHRALDLLKDNGVISFITTNYYITATGAFKLRSDFYRRTAILSLINFNEVKIFPSAMGQHNMITLLEKTKVRSKIASICITKKTGIANVDTIQKIISGKDNESEYRQICQKDLFEGEDYQIRFHAASSNATTLVAQVLMKIKGNNNLLGAICNVNMGVQSGADYVGEKLLYRAIEKKFVDRDYLMKNNITVGTGIYVVDENQLSNFSQSEISDVIKPFIKNSDIQKYHISLEDKKFYIYIDSKLAIENYPNIKAHLQRFRPILRAREQVRNDENNWFWIRGAKRKYFVNTGHHILCPYRAKENSFAFSDGNILGAGDVYFITQKNDKSFNLKYILALLNAKLFYFWLFHKGKRKGNILELYQKPLSNIPIKIMSDDGQKPFMEMVDRILSLTLSKDYLKNQPKQQKVQEYQKQIDKMLYKLYDLNDNEIELVDNFSKQK